MLTGKKIRESGLFIIGFVYFLKISRHFLIDDTSNLRRYLLAECSRGLLSNKINKRVALLDPLMPDRFID